MTYREARNLMLEGKSVARSRWLPGHSISEVITQPARPTIHTLTIINEDGSLRRRSAFCASREDREATDWITAP